MKKIMVVVDPGKVNLNDVVTGLKDIGYTDRTCVVVRARKSVWGMFDYPIYESSEPMGSLETSV